MRFSADPNPSPLLVRASSIRTLSKRSNNPAAFLVKNGRIQEVFQTNEKANKCAEHPNISTLDRPNHCVLPSFGDAHVHLKWLGDSLREPDLSDCSSYEDIRTKLTEWINNHSLSPGELLHGRGWNPNQVTEQRWPHRSDLNHPLLSKYPIALLSHDHHAYWVNETFLHELPEHIPSASSPDGRIMKDEQGQRSGVFVEAAIEPVTQLVEQKQNAQKTHSVILNAMEELVRYGITCVHDFGEAEHLKAHKKLRSNYDLLPHVCFFCFQGSWEQIPSELHKPGRIADGLEFAGMKLFADGTLGAQTAALLEPYQKAINNSSSQGELVNEPEELKQYAQQAARNKFSTAIHAIGDRAVRIGLDVLSTAYDGSPDPDYSPRIEHAQLVAGPDRHRFSKHGIVSSMQPCHLFQDRSVAKRVLGNRTEQLFPVQSLLNQNASILFGSDAPIESPNPLRNLQSAVFRNQPGGSSPAPTETISLKKALSFSCKTPFTYLNCSPNRGMICSGNPADFVVVSKDPMSELSNPLTDINVLETYIRGQRVHSS